MNDSIFPMIGEEGNLPFYVTGVGGHANQHHIIRSNGYHHFQVLYCVKGSGILNIEGKEISFGVNTGFILYPNIIHEYYAVKEPWETHWISFEGSGVPGLLNTLDFNKSKFFYIPNVILLDNLLNEIYINMQSKNISKGFICSGLLYNVLINLRNSLIKQDSHTTSMSLEQLKPVLSYIDNNFSKFPNLNEMAEIIEVSPQYLCRLFKNFLYMRPFVYITKRRIEEAKHLLLNNSISIKDLSKEIGYNDASYFCSIFKRYEGISPNEFRNMHKKN